MDLPLRAFPNWILRITCERCFKDRMLSEASAPPHQRERRGAIWVIMLIGQEFTFREAAGSNNRSNRTMKPTPEGRFVWVAMVALRGATMLAALWAGIIIITALVPLTSLLVTLATHVP
jgi:hypothetical protein